MKKPNSNSANAKKLPQSRQPNQAYLLAFERLDQALAENTPSNDEEKINLLRLKLFGEIN